MGKRIDPCTFIQMKPRYFILHMIFSLRCILSAEKGHFNGFILSLFHSRIRTNLGASESFEETLHMNTTHILLYTFQNSAAAAAALIIKSFNHHCRIILGKIPEQDLFFSSNAILQMTASSLRYLEM